MSNVSKCFFCANKKDYDAKFGYFGCDYSGQECKDYSMYEPKVKPKPITNADKIRSMTDEELADYLRYYSDMYARYDMDWLDWLKEEAKDD